MVLSPHSNARKDGLRKRASHPCPFLCATVRCHEVRQKEHRAWNQTTQSAFAGHSPSKWRVSSETTQPRARHLVDITPEWQKGILCRESPLQCFASTPTWALLPYSTYSEEKPGSFPPLWKQWPAFITVPSAVQSTLRTRAHSRLSESLQGYPHYFSQRKLSRKVK